MSGTNGAQDLIGRIKSILTQAKDLWRGYVLAKEWVVANKAHRAEQLAYILTCWNCGGAHRMSDCVKPKNQANIDKAKTTWQNNRKQSNGGNSGDKGKSADKNGYSRSKFEKPATA